MFNRYHKLLFFLMFTMTFLHSNVQVDNYLSIQHAWEDHKEVNLTHYYGYCKSLLFYTYIQVKSCLATLKKST